MLIACAVRCARLQEESQDKLDYVLTLSTESFMERRLQTQVFKLGLAKSMHHARVLIRQRHIRCAAARPALTRVVCVRPRLRGVLTRLAAGAPFVSASVGKQIVNVPSFMVRVDSQKHIDFALNSPFGGGRPGRVKRRNLKARAPALAASSLPHALTRWR